MVSVNGKEAAEQASQQVHNDLRRAGLIERTEKCIWTPTQCLKWLGFDFDLAKGVLKVLKGKIEALCNQLKYALQAKALPC